jgi:hypothetical protein
MSVPALCGWILKPSNLTSCSQSGLVGGAGRSLGLAMGMKAMRLSTGRIWRALAPLSSQRLDGGLGYHYVPP